MTDFETVGEHQAFANDLGVLIHERIVHATPIEVLSSRGDKLLQVLQEPDGATFVTRSFSDMAVGHIEQRRMGFQEAWDAMHEVFADAGLEVVPSHLLAANGRYPFVAVSEHVVDGVPLVDAPTETKMELAESFAKLIQPNRSGYFIAPEMINAGMFTVVSREEGEHKVMLLDTDPHILPSMYDARDENLASHYINTLADLFWDEWCTPEEREAVFTKLFLAMNKFVGEDVDLMSKPGVALQKVHMMSNGMDVRDMPLFS